MKKEDLLKWFLEELLPDLVASGRFRGGEEEGGDQTVERCEFEAIQSGTSSFASFPSYAKLFLRTAAGPSRRDLLVKFQCQDPLFRKNMRTVPQYRNEAVMYNEVLPGFVEFLRKRGRENLLQDVVPKCHFASHSPEDPDKAIVILEDLRTLGYGTSESVTELDLNHCLIAFEKLARFHAVSFAMKAAEGEAFDKLKNSFVHVWFSDDPENRVQAQEFKARCARRGIEYLLSRGDSEVPVEYLERFRKLLEPTFDLLLDLHAPREPLSVICHGDFNRNNLLFRYAGGKAADARLIDFQTFLYGSPCLDLSFFLYMNTTLEFREAHMDEVLAHYHSTLVETTAGILGEAEPSTRGRLPLEAFRAEFGRVAAAAYVTVSFFLPVMMTPPPEDFEGDVINKSPREMAEDVCVLGGEVVSRRIADVLVDFYRRKFYA